MPRNSDYWSRLPTAKTECFEAGVRFARCESIVPAPEATHAVKGAIDQALACKVSGESKAILFNLCGHGHLDMQAYTDYFAGKLHDQSYDEGELAMALAGIAVGRRIARIEVIYGVLKNPFHQSKYICVHVGPDLRTVEELR